MKEKENLDRAVILSGDGDFLPVLKYLKGIGKEIIILARGPRTAREIRQFAGSDFRDFEYLKVMYTYFLHFLGNLRAYENYAQFNPRREIPVDKTHSRG